MYIAISRIASVVNAIYIACWHPMLIAFRPQMRCSSDWLVGCCYSWSSMWSPEISQAVCLGLFAKESTKSLADCGAAFLSVWTMGDSRLLSLLHGARLLATTSRIRKEEKKETKKIARGIFRSLAPLLGTAGSLSDCGIKPTIAELNFSRR